MGNKMAPYRICVSGYRDVYLHFKDVFSWTVSSSSFSSCINGKTRSEKYDRKEYIVFAGPRSPNRGLNA